MTEGIKKVADALSRTMSEDEVRAEIQRLEEKKHAKKKAEEVIYAALGAWTGADCREGASIPIVRDGRTVGWIHQSILGSNAVEKVTEPSLLEEKAALEDKKAQFQRVAESSEALLDSLGGISAPNRIRLEVSGGVSINNLGRWKSMALPERLVGEIGTVSTAVIAAQSLSACAREEVEEIDRQLDEWTGQRGRPRYIALHAVALELARLYARVTGKRPTYSEGVDGVSGEFTPVLRDVFDALGWEKMGLRGPAEAAKEQITEEDLRYEESPIGGLLSAVSQGSQE
jgi:hypothetical protein